MRSKRIRMSSKIRAAGALIESVLISFFLTFSPVPASADNSLPSSLAMDRCEQASDCVPAPDVFPSCFSYCRGKECEGAEACPILNRFFKNFPNCAARVPCLPIKSKIICLNNQCNTKR